MVMLICHQAQERTLDNILLHNRPSFRFCLLVLPPSLDVYCQPYSSRYSRLWVKVTQRKAMGKTPALSAVTISDHQSEQRLWRSQEQSRMSKFMVDVGYNCLFVSLLTSQQHVRVTQGRICSDNFNCGHTEIGVADQTFYLTRSQYTDTGPISPIADAITPGSWQGSHWSANF